MRYSATGTALVIVLRGVRYAVAAAVHLEGKRATAGDTKTGTIEPQIAKFFHRRANRRRRMRTRP